MTATGTHGGGGGGGGGGSGAIAVPRGPVPFVGRERALAAIRGELAIVPVVSLHGPLGAGKTRLIGELAASLGAPTTIVSCHPGDRAIAVAARAERALRCAGGTLAATLAREARVLILDDVHHLGAGDRARLLVPLVPGPAALGRVVVVGREPLIGAVGTQLAELEIEGLDVDATAQLWRALEARFGAAIGGDAAAMRARGMPLALRREYARARFGDAAWALAQLPAPARAALEALAALRVPAASAAIAALAQLAPLAPGGELAAALAELVARQLIDEVGDGRYAMHELVRADALARVAPERRRELAAHAAALIASTAPHAAGARLMWQAGDDGALGALDAVARTRETVWQWLAAGDRARAADTVLAGRELAAHAGGSGELEALVDAIADAAAAAAGADAEPSALAALRIELCVRGGRFTEARERASLAPHALSPRGHAELAVAAADIDSARRALEVLAVAGADGATGAGRDASERLRALALLVELDLLAGAPESAVARLATATAQLSAGDPLARAHVHLAAARLDEYSGKVAAMRSALARAHGACKSAPATAAATELAVVIDARRAIGLAREGRVVEAAAALDQATAAARDLSAVAPADELALARAVIVRRRGDSEAAAQILGELVRHRRERGDELGALKVELDAADLAIVRGQPMLATELATAARSSSARRSLAHLAARGEVIVAAVDVIELRLDAALTRLEPLLGAVVLDAATAASAAVWIATARATLGQRAGAVELAHDAGAEARDELERKLAAAEVALAAGDAGGALQWARETAALAERAGRTIELASALVIVARLELARGDRGTALSTASRAAREAHAAGLVRARVHALLALSALSRDDDSSSAVSYARDAAELAATAGLPVERLVAHAALDAIAGHEAIADPTAPNAAAMAATAIEGASRLLTDLGLTAQRPFRVIDADGTPSDVADANPEILRLSARALAVDGVREVIWRHGSELADLRRRSLLKRLLFLFSAAPNRVFSKEAIVQAVWNVEYHPLRHDAALFTNIMRIRRLLGEDGSDIIRVTEDGYRFVPPRDFLFVIPR